MVPNRRCPIWGTPARFDNSEGRDGIYPDSPRAGGKYFISGTAAVITQRKYDDQIKARLTSMLIEQRRLGNKCPEISSETIETAKRRPNLSVHERADRLLEYIKEETVTIGKMIVLEYKLLKELAWSESIIKEEVHSLIDYIGERGWVAISQSNSSNLKLTVNGYAHLEAVETKKVDSSKAFVAMWFDDSMSVVWEQGIKPAIEAAGYEPVRIDKQEHIDKIDDRIIVEIKRSRFIVADFTQGKSGARGGVYYEAGYAHGLNIPVIFCCRKNALEHVHFDTQQYNHIVWEEENLTELKEALTNRIAAVIGDGPRKQLSSPST